MPPDPTCSCDIHAGHALHAKLSARIFPCIFPTAAKSRGFRFCNP
jgi:hypothetical protein